MLKGTTAPTEPLHLHVQTVDGTTDKEVTLSPSDYYLNDRGRPVIYHDKLQSLADETGGVCAQVTTSPECTVFHSFKSFCFVYRAKAEANGSVYEEIGEASPVNLVQNPDRLNTYPLGFRYPAIMADKRAKDRLLIRLLGLKGQVLSDVEIDEPVAFAEEKSIPAIPSEAQPVSEPPVASQEETVPSPPPLEIPVMESSPSPFDSAFDDGFDTPQAEPDIVVEPTLDESVAAAPTDETASFDDANDTSEVESLKELKVAFGKYRQSPITLGELMTKDPNTVRWLAGVPDESGRCYKGRSNASKDMLQLHEAAKQLLQVS